MAAPKGNSNGSGKRSNEFRERCRQRMLGVSLHNKPHTEESKQKISRARKGKNIGSDNHMWKGGVSSHNYKERRRFRRELQKKIFERDSYKCVKCKRGGNLQVDHIKKWSEYPELRFEEGNCRTLCMECHYMLTYNRNATNNCTWGHNMHKSTEKYIG